MKIIDLQNGIEKFLEPTPVVVATALVDSTTPADTRGVSLWGTKLLVADGVNGLRIVDIAIPSAPRLDETIREVPGQAPINEANQQKIRAYAVIHPNYNAE